MNRDVAGKPMLSRKRWMLLLGSWTLAIGVVLGIAGVVATLAVGASVPWLARTLFPLASVCGLCGVLWLIMVPWVSDDPVDAAHRRYMRMVLPAFAGYALAMIFVGVASKTELPVWARVVLAMLPVLPIAWVVWAMWDYIRRCDELERRVQIEATYITCGIVGLATFAGGMLQRLDVLELDGALLWVLPLMFLVYGLAGWCCRRKYGLSGMC